MGHLLLSWVKVSRPALREALHYFDSGYIEKLNERGKVLSVTVLLWVHMFE